MSEAQRGERAALLVGAAIIGLAVLWGYRDAPSGSFHFDDKQNVVDHRPVHMETFGGDALLQAALHGRHPQRALANVTFAVDWWRGGGEAEAFLATNVGIHLLASLAVLTLIWLLVRRSGARGSVAAWSAVLGAAVWSLHPIQVQAVAYVVQRMTSLAALFVVASVVAYVLGRSRWGVPAYLAAGLFAVLGALSKENAFALPAFLWLAEYGIVRQGRPLVQRRLDRWLLAAPLVLAAYVVVDLLSGGPLYQRFAPGYGARDFTLAERLLTQPRVVLFHLSQWLWPHPGRFSIEHDVAVSRGLLSPPATLFALAGIALLVAWGVSLLLRKERRVWGVAVLWVPVGLAIESTFVPLEMVFEHRMYLPSLGLAAMFALGASHLGRRLSHRSLRLAAPVAAALPVVVALSTSARVRDWHDDVTLYERAVAVAPRSARAWYNLGLGYESQSRPRDAIDAYSRCLEQDVDYARAWHNRGLLRLALDRDVEGALQDFGAAISVGEWETAALNSRGALLRSLGKLEEASRDFGRIIASPPAEAAPWQRGGAYYNRALIHRSQGRWEAAREDLAQAAALHPELPGIFKWLGEAQLRTHRADEAVQSLSTACSRSPQDAGARTLLQQAVRARGAPTAPSASSNGSP